MSKVMDIVNERIIKELEAGTIPWKKPWTGVRNGAYSRSTGKPYSLINQMLLGKPGEYVTITQIMEAGAKLKKDEKPSIVVFWKQISQKEEDASGKEKSSSFPMLRYYRVFHIDQCEGLEPLYKPEELPVFVPDEEADRLCQSYLERSGCTLEHVKQNRAFYSPTLDAITMPLRDQFPTTEGYYATAFHEIGHSTGHMSRFARFQNNEYSDEKYSREELVAELISASVMNLLGLETSHTIRNAASYIDSWLHALKNDRKMILWAASRAEKALGIITEEVDIKAAVVATESTAAAAKTAKPKVSAKPKKPTKTKVAATTAKPATNPNAAAVAFAKACAKRMSKRPEYAGAFVFNDRQYITNGYVMVAYDNPIDGLPQADTSKGNGGPAMENAINVTRVGVEQKLPVLSELLAQFKEAKAKSKEKDFTQYTKLGVNYYNTEYLSTAMALAGVTGGGSARVQTANKPMYIQGQGCEVVVQPVRVSGMPGEDVWRPKLSA